MNPRTIASAYLNSLLNSPTSHLCDFHSKPLPELIRLDLNIWLGGFASGLHDDSQDGPFPAVDQILTWVYLAIDRYFDVDYVPLPEETMRPLALAASASVTVTMTSVKPPVDNSAEEEIAIKPVKKKSASVRLEPMRLRLGHMA